MEHEPNITGVKQENKKLYDRAKTKMEKIHFRDHF